MTAKRSITVSREVHRAIAALAIGQLNDRETVYHPNGTVTFPISNDVYAQLLAIDADPELAVRKLLNMGMDA